MSDVTTTVAAAANVVDRAAYAPDFRAQLLASPAATLQSAGVPVPSGSTVQVLQNTSSMRYLNLPQRPSGVSDADLGKPPMPSAASSVPEMLQAWVLLVIHAWLDPNLKSQLLQNSNAVLAQYGITMPAGITARVVEAQMNVLHVVIPPAA